MRKDGLLASYLSDELGVSNEELSLMWDTMARAIIYHATTVGPVVTPFGRVAMTDAGLAIVEQNQDVIQSLADASCPSSIKVGLCNQFIGA